MFERRQIIEHLYQAQDNICASFAELEEKKFQEDKWKREGGGGGRTRVIEDGEVFERGGVNVSEVHGVLQGEALRAMSSRQGWGENLEVRPFFAAGISMVLHPSNPMAPTMHANYRYFECGDGVEKAWWFGGGADLTPSYLFDLDAKFFHSKWKEVCDKHDVNFYPRFKKWCDEYFRLTHRNEARGVGGIFFDDLNDRSPEKLFDFMRDCTATIIPAYVPLLQERVLMPFTKAEKEWQQIRRGRYVEFNLIYDRGTKFGLATGGRTESILVSMPRTANWSYQHEPAPQSREAALVEVLRTPRDWI